MKVPHALEAYCHFAGIGSKMAPRVRLQSRQQTLSDRLVDRPQYLMS
jgi:hypothetical protein